MGLAFGVAVAVGSMIGAGILRAPHDVATLLPAPFWFLAVWVIGGLYALLGANAVAELSTMDPQSGGQYVFARKAFGPFAGFLVGWNDWVSTCAAVAAIAFVFSETLVSLFGLSATLTVAVAVASVAAVVLLVWRGSQAADRAQRATSVAKAVAFMALVVACLVFAASRGMARDPSYELPHGTAFLAALVVALQGVVFAYDGWVGVVYFGEEVRDPSREIPRALFGGVVAVMAIYLLVNVAILAVVPLSGIAADPLPAAAAATKVFGGSGGVVVQALVVIALPSALVANLLFGSRVIFALGREAPMLGWLATIGSEGVPRAAMVATAAATILFALTGTFERVIALCAFLFVAGYAASFSAVFLLRRRMPHAPRPWRAWGHPYTTGIVLLGSLAFLGGTIAAAPRDGAIAVALAVLAYPVYRFTRRGA